MLSNSSSDLPQAASAASSSHAHPPRPPLLRGVSLTSSLEDSLPQGDLLECPICYGVLEEASNGSCGHVFCSKCIKSYFQSRTEVQCPICRATLISDQIFPNLIARHYVGKLRVKCPFALSLSRSESASESNECLCTWNGLMEDLKDHMKHCPLRPAQFTRIPHGAISYYASSDVRGGGTGGEFVDNLGLEGQENWNKWYCNPESATIRLTFAIPFKVHQYSLQSANDVIERSPRAWDLIGITQDNQRVLLDSVSDDLFSGYWETKTFIVKEPSDTLFKAVELHIKSTRGYGQGCQLGRLFLYYSEANAGAGSSHAGTSEGGVAKRHWAVRSLQRDGSVNFMNDPDPLSIMFHFNPRPIERQIVMNTCDPVYAWGVEERITLLEGRRGFALPLEAFIRVTDVGYEIYMDGSLKHVYHHRVPWSSFSHIRCDVSEWHVE